MALGHPAHVANEVARDASKQNRGGTLTYRDAFDAQMVAVMLREGEKPGAVEMCYTLARRIFPVAFHYYKRDIQARKRVQLLTLAPSTVVWAAAGIMPGRLVWWFPDKNRTVVEDFVEVWQDEGAKE